jgi:hypothetical protein
MLHHRKDEARLPKVVVDLAEPRSTTSLLTVLNSQRKR